MKEEIGLQINEDDCLKASPYFCMMPWVHMHFWPSGKVFPCCISNSEMPIGQYGTQSIEQIWNSPEYKRIRQNMLLGKPSRECERCYRLEKDMSILTLRQTANVNFKKHFPLVKQTDFDGTVPRVNLAYLDVRFSNVCNFRCQTCGPNLSSSWYEDQLKAFGDSGQPKKQVISPPAKFWNELKPLLMGVEQAYFAGGEPLLADENYKILEYWIENNKLDVEMVFTTNFSVLKHKKWDILELWPKFSRVNVAASLDDSHERAEYLRKGTKWKRIVDNRRRMMERCPNTRFEITPTISVYNVAHFPDFHEEWIAEGLVEPNNIRLNVLLNPGYMAVHVIPQRHRARLIEKYQQVMDRLCVQQQQSGKPFDNIRESYMAVIRLLNEGERPDLLPRLFDRMRKIDFVRGESSEAVFPEFREYFAESLHD